MRGSAEATRWSRPQFPCAYVSEVGRWWHGFWSPSVEGLDGVNAIVVASWRTCNQNAALLAVVPVCPCRGFRQVFCSSVGIIALNDSDGWLRGYYSRLDFSRAHDTRPSHVSVRGILISWRRGPWCVQDERRLGSKTSYSLSIYIRKARKCPHCQYRILKLYLVPKWMC